MKWLCAVVLSLSLVACATDAGQTAAVSHAVYELGGSSPEAEEAQRLAAVLQTGASPAELKIVEIAAVSDRK